MTLLNDHSWYECTNVTKDCQHADVSLSERILGTNEEKLFIVM